jgi:hypothetical protein
LKYLETKGALAESRIANMFLTAEVERYRALIIQNAPSNASSAANNAERAADVCQQVAGLLHIRE